MTASGHKPIKIVKHQKKGEPDGGTGKKTAGSGGVRKRQLKVSAGKSRGNPVVVWSIVGVVLVGVLFGAIMAIRNQTRKDRVAVYQLQQMRHKASEVFDDFDKVSDKVVALESEAMARWETFDKVLNEYAEIRERRVTTESPAPASESSSSPQPEVKSEPELDLDALVPEPKKAAEEDDDFELPEGITPLEVILKRREEEKRRREERGSAGGETKVEETTTAPEPGSGFQRRRVSRRESRFDALTKKAKSARETVALNARLAREMHASAMHAYRLSKSDKLIAKVRERRAELIKYRDGANSYLKKSKDALATLDECREEAEAMREEALAAWEKRMAAAEEAKRQEEHQQLIARENKQVEKTRRDLVGLYGENRFDDAIELAKRVHDGCETDQARLAMKLEVERCEHLLSLFDFLVEGLQREKMGFGWIQDGVKRDILGGNRKHLRLRDGKVPWARVGQTQMMELITYYSRRPHLPLSAKARNMFAGAILFSELGNARYSDALKEEAVILLPSLKSDAGRLL